jgi:hypothetical protein
LKKIFDKIALMGERNKRESYNKLLFSASSHSCFVIEEEKQLHQ